MRSNVIPSGIHEKEEIQNKKNNFYLYLFFFNYIIFRKSKITKLVTKKIFNQRSMKLKKE